jgi:hypothetical protein
MASKQVTAKKSADSKYVDTNMSLVEEIKQFCNSGGSKAKFSIGTPGGVVLCTIQGFGTDHLIGNGTTPTLATPHMLIVPFASISYFSAT